MNTGYKPNVPNDAPVDGAVPVEAAGPGPGGAFAGPPGDSLSFDLLERPEAWPDDPALQSELAHMLEIHLAVVAHADQLAPALNPSKGVKRFATVWLLPAAALLIAFLPAANAVGKVRETRRMKARGAALEIQMQKRLQAELWSDFFSDSLELLKLVQAPAKYCGPRREDRSLEVEQARRLYALGRSLPLDGLDDPEVVDAGKTLQNWLTEVSANDSCMTLRRSHELTELAAELDLEGKAAKLNRRLKEVFS